MRLLVPLLAILFYIVFVFQSLENDYMIKSFKNIDPLETMTFSRKHFQDQKINKYKYIFL